MNVACRVPVRCTIFDDCVSMPQRRPDPVAAAQRCDGYESIAPEDADARRWFDASGGLHLCRYSAGGECLRFRPVIAEWKDTVAP